MPDDRAHQLRPDEHPLELEAPQSIPAGLEAQVPHPRPFVRRLLVGGDQASRTIEHVSNIEYLRWIDRIAELHGDAVGYTRQRLLDDDVMWFVARHEVDYLAEVFPGDELLLATWVREAGRVKAWRDALIYRTGDGAVVCRASTLWVLVRLSSRRPARLPPPLRMRLDALESLADGKDGCPCTLAC